MVYVGRRSSRRRRESSTHSLLPFRGHVLVSTRTWMCFPKLLLPRCSSPHVITTPPFPSFRAVFWATSTPALCSIALPARSLRRVSLGVSASLSRAHARLRQQALMLRSVPQRPPAIRRLSFLQFQAPPGPRAFPLPRASGWRSSTNTSPSLRRTTSSMCARRSACVYARRPIHTRLQGSASPSLRLLRRLLPNAAVAGSLCLLSP